MTAQEKRLSVRNMYKTIIGRNYYSQDRRNYCYKKYSDGKYYSDCSSSICYTYKEVGLSFGILNTAGMWTSKKLVDVPVTIKNGVIQNPSVLRIGDMLLFAGTSAARKNYGYVGHVEMVGEISGSVIQLYGHGSGRPKRHEMNAYCKSRYNTKTKNTPIGNTGLLKVRRFIVDDKTEPENTLGSRVLKKGMTGNDVKEMQAKLIALNYSCGSCGADGDFGSDTLKAVKAFQKDHGITVSGTFDAEMYTTLMIELGSKSYVRVRHGNYYVRKGADKSATAIGVVHDGDKIPYLGETKSGWNKISFNGTEAWLSTKAGDVMID